MSVSSVRALLVAAVTAGMTCLAGPAAASPGPTYNYVALGDSYTAATGYDTLPDTSDVPLGCFQSRTDYPQR